MPAARLLIGPLLRRVVGTRATVWVETGAPAVVTVRTADGAARHRAHLLARTATTTRSWWWRGSPRTARTPYEVLVDGEVVWPLPERGFPPSVIRTRAADDRDQPVRLIFGSCRETTQHATRPQAAAGRAGRVRPAADGRPGRGRAAGPAGAARRPGLRRRDLADGAAAARAGAGGGRQGAPADQVVSFDEYTKLYLESWRDPEIRWLLSTVPSVMIFDDHEIIDDWNTSAVLARRHARAAVVGRADPQRASPPTGSTSTWATSSPDEIAADPVYAKVDRRRGRHRRAARVRRSGSTPRPTWRTTPSAGAPCSTSGATRWTWAGPGWSMLDNRCSRVLDAGQPGDAAAGRVGLVPRPGARRLRPPGGRRLAALAAAAGHPPPRGVERAAGRLAPALGGARWPRSCAGRWTWSTGPRSGARSTRSASCSPGSAAARPGSPATRVGAGPAYAAAGVDQRALRRRAPLVRGPGPVRRPGGGHPGAPAHLLADPQPGAGRRCVR